MNTEKQYEEEKQQLQTECDTQDILILKKRNTKPKKLDKKDVMPTQASTKSLLISHTSPKRCQTNTEVLAPLFRSPPTDYGTLHTALKLAQGISACVVGPERRTLITLDLDLYQRALKIQQSTLNTN